MTRLEMLIDFRAEISVPRMETQDREALLHELERMQFSPGIVIYNVMFNLTRSYRDPENDGIIAVSGGHVYREAYRLAREAMTLLARHNHKGYFKIKYGIFWGADEFVGMKDFTIDIEKDFPGFKAVSEGSVYPGIYSVIRGHYAINNFIYIGKPGSLPTHEEIIRFILANFGNNPNRIVDFSGEFGKLTADQNTRTTRIASMYQNSGGSALLFNDKMEERRDKWLAYPRNDTSPKSYTTLTEQVCLVGEPR